MVLSSIESPWFPDSSRKFVWRKKILFSLICNIDAPNTLSTNMGIGTSIFFAQLEQNKKLYLIGLGVYSKYSPTRPLQVFNGLGFHYKFLNVISCGDLDHGIQLCTLAEFHKINRAYLLSTLNEFVLRFMKLYIFA
jgi:hypothetical protein